MDRTKEIPQITKPEKLYHHYAETSVIGCMLLNAESDAATQAVESLKPDDFYLRSHRDIWAQIVFMATRGQRVDMITLDEALMKQGSEVTFSLLGEYAKNTPSQASMHSYVKLVKDYSSLRKAMGAMSDANSALYENGDIQDRINKSLSFLSEIGADESESELKDPADVAIQVVDRMEAAFQSNKTIVGLSSGFENIDRMTGGFRDGDLIIVAARPSMGKSTLCLNFAENVALISKEPKPVLFISLEMPADQLVSKTIARCGNLMLGKIMNGQAIGNDHDVARLGTALELINKNRQYLRIDDKGGQHITQIQARAKRAKMKMGGLSLVVVDYLQMISAEGESQTIRIGNVSKGLKELAKSLGCPVIALSQLNRALAGKPELKNLRDSGSIEQDADVVMFLHDEDYEGNRGDHSLTEIIFAKQRLAAIGSTYLQPELMFSRFSDTNRLPEPKHETKEKTYKREFK